MSGGTTLDAGMVRENVLIQARGLNWRKDYPGLHTLLRDRARDDFSEEPELGLLCAIGFIHAGDQAVAIDILACLYDPAAENTRVSRRIAVGYGCTLAYACRLEEALAVSRWALELCDRAGDVHMAGAAFGNLGMVHMMRGDYGEGLAYVRRATACLQRGGDLERIGGGHHNTALAKAKLGDWGGADRSFAMALACYAIDSIDYSLLSTRTERALVRLKCGDAALAERQARKALAAARASERPAQVGNAARVLAHILIETGRTGEATVELLDTALEASTAAGDLLTMAEIRELQARTAEMEGDRDAAIHHSDAAQALYRSFGGLQRAWRPGDASDTPIP